MNTKRVILIILAAVFTLLSVSWVVVRSVKTVDLNHGCINYLKRAADAGTVELAKPQLDKAIEYLEEHELNSGIVSIFFKDPANDLGFFYQNLIASQAELEKVTSDTTQLEESNLLLRLRKTLLSEGGSVTHPDGLSIHPNNLFYFLWSILSLILAIFFWIWQYRQSPYYY